MFEKIFGKKEESADDKPVSREELDALGIKASMTRKELDDHMATIERKKALGENKGADEMPALTNEEIKIAEEALAKNQEIGK